VVESDSHVLNVDNDFGKNAKKVKKHRSSVNFCYRGSVFAFNEWNKSKVVNAEERRRMMVTRIQKLDDYCTTVQFMTIITAPFSLGRLIRLPTERMGPVSFCIV